MYMWMPVTVTETNEAALRSIRMQPGGPGLWRRQSRRRKKRRRMRKLVR